MLLYWQTAIPRKKQRDNSVRRTARRPQVKGDKRVNRQVGTPHGAQPKGQGRCIVLYTYISCCCCLHMNKSFFLRPHVCAQGHQRYIQYSYVLLDTSTYQVPGNKYAEQYLRSRIRIVISERSDWGRVLNPSKPLGTRGIEYYFMVCTQKFAADWLLKSNRFQAFPPCLKFWILRKKCSNSNPCLQDRTAHLERAYVQ